MTNKELNLKILEIASSKAEWEIDALVKNAEKLQQFVFGFRVTLDDDTVTDEISDIISEYRERAKSAIPFIDKEVVDDKGNADEKSSNFDTKLSDLTQEDKSCLLQLFIKMFVVEPKALAECSEGIYLPKFDKLPEWLNEKDQKALRKAYIRAIGTPINYDYGKVNAPKGVYDNVISSLTDSKDTLTHIYVDKMKEDALRYFDQEVKLSMIDHIMDLPADSKFVQQVKELWENYQKNKHTEPSKELTDEEIFEKNIQTFYSAEVFNECKDFMKYRLEDIRSEPDPTYIALYRKSDDKFSVVATTYDPEFQLVDAEQFKDHVVVYCIKDSNKTNTNE
jgi:hypothetical protein